MPENQDGQYPQWSNPQQPFPQGQPSASQWQQPQTPYPQQYPGQQYPMQVPYPQQSQQVTQQYGMPQQGDFMTEQPQPSYGQAPYGQYGQGYGTGQPQMGYPQQYPQQYQMGGVPMQQGGYDPLAKNAYIALAIAVVGILLLFVGKVWGIIFCCLGISLGIRGLYSRARVAAIISIVLNSISLVISLLVFIAQCSDLIS